MKKLNEYEKVRKMCDEAMRLASTHDPDHAKQIQTLQNKVTILERQVERLGAPSYRVVFPGKLPKAMRTK